MIDLVKSKKSYSCLQTNNKLNFLPRGSTKYLLPSQKNLRLNAFNDSVDQTLGAFFFTSAVSIKLWSP